MGLILVVLYVFFFSPLEKLFFATSNPRTVCCVAQYRTSVVSDKKMKWFPWVDFFISRPQNYFFSKKSTSNFSITRKITEKSQKSGWWGLSKMIFSKICFFRKNLHQILSMFEKWCTWLKSNPWPPDQFFMIFWWFSRNLASFRNFRSIFCEIFQICAPVISRSTQQNHLEFLSELSETFF